MRTGTAYDDHRAVKCDTMINFITLKRHQIRDESMKYVGDLFFRRFMTVAQRMRGHRTDWGVFS